MREYFLSLLILAVLSPSIVPLLPHEALHAVHDAHMAQHSSDRYPSHHDGQHVHQHHLPDDHSVDADHSNHHHPIQIDAISYLSDYLHIDLKQPCDTALNIVEFDGGAGFYEAASNWNFKISDHLKSVQNRGPPIYAEHLLQPATLPLFLATQRYRV